MSKKSETNEQFIRRIMNFGCPTGALIQPFILIAIENYAKVVQASPVQDVAGGLVSGEAWKETAQFVLDELEARK